MHLIFFNVFRNSEANASVLFKLPRYYIRGDVFSMIIKNWHITRSERVKTCYRSTRIQCVVLICTDAIIQQEQFMIIKSLCDTNSSTFMKRAQICL